MTNRFCAFAALFLLAALPSQPRSAWAADNLSPAEVRAIAEEATIYAFPMVMNYAVFYEYFVDAASSQFKKPIGQLDSIPRVYTYEDTAVVTPNSDTPYSLLAMDLRSEPFVLTVPAIEAERYYSIQLVDLYTFNFGYIGSRATGSKAGSYMVVGPQWKGIKPEGIDGVLYSETEFAFAVYRTQLFNPADLENVKKIQAAYQAQPLSAFLKLPAPAAAPAVEWAKFDKKIAETDPFVYLNFILQFCPTDGPAEVETALRAKFAKLGIEAGKPFDAAAISPETCAAMAEGMKSGIEKIKVRRNELGRNENGWRVGGAFGNRKFFNGDWTLRAAAALAGIYGNDEVEALYPLLTVDSDGEKCDCSKHDYTITFAKGDLPPVNAFWSVTMYDGKTQFLIKNPIDRYLINSPMLPILKTNDDGSLTIYLQKDLPSPDKAANWLPAPDGPIYVAMRLYWPKESALNGTWKPPAVRKAK